MATFLSLPVRECGLKQDADFCVLLYNESLPVRECGLKHILSSDLVLGVVSLPVRECGLKQEEAGGHQRRSMVTPRAGVWIETSATWASRCRSAGHSPCGSVD